jgi:hypothetical protein
MGEAEVDRRPYVHEMHVTREAVDVIAACNNRVNAIGEAFGRDSDRYRRAEETWRRSLSNMFGMFFGGDSRVTRDGELSLLVVTGGFVYGVIFHGERRTCTREGCKAVINDDGRAWTYMPDYPMCDDHVLSYPLDAPTPGDWSFHS